MEKGCEKNLKRIVAGFRQCRNAFTAIGDETRQLILLTLLESELSGIRVGEIAQKTHLTRPSVSHHLKILKEAGIVAVRPAGTKNYYYFDADSEAMDRLLRMLDLAKEIMESLPDRSGEKS